MQITINIAFDEDNFKEEMPQYTPYEYIREILLDGFSGQNVDIWFDNKDI